MPLNVPVTYDDTKPFARAVAELLEKQHPKQIVSRMTKSLRGGKVLIDWSQNDEHKTTVCVYSLRAKERPTVSTPVTWDEVARRAEARRGTQALTFEHTDVLERVERDGDLFAPVLALQQELPQFGEPDAIATMLDRNLLTLKAQMKLGIALRNADAHTRLATYLNDHLGGASGGVELARRLCASQRGHRVRAAAASASRGRSRRTSPPCATSWRGSGVEEDRDQAGGGVGGREGRPAEAQRAAARLLAPQPPGRARGHDARRDRQARAVGRAERALRPRTRGSRASTSRS